MSQNCSPAYQQALDDFGITKLIMHLSSYADADFNAALMNLEEQELESLAAILIERLTKNLTGKLIASYLNAIRHGNSNVISDPINVEIPPPAINLPANFSDNAIPHYQEGDRVIWRPLSNTTDWGIVIGRYYAYASMQCSWVVCYLVQLDENSPSAAWTVTDTVWEEDLEHWTGNGDQVTGLREDEGSLPSFVANPRTFHSTTLSPSLEPTSCCLTISKFLRTSPGDYKPEGDRTSPRTLTQREENLISLYSNCRLGMTPRMFHRKWAVTYEQIAAICDRSTATVQRWFSRGRNSRRPSPVDLRHLGIMNFLFEHFEEIPAALRTLLCASTPN